LCWIWHHKGCLFCMSTVFEDKLGYGLTAKSVCFY
jgi:hypothetical protein